MKKINFLFILLHTLFSYLSILTSSSQIVSFRDTSEEIYRANPYLFPTKDISIWQNESIKWIDRMQINTILFDNLLVYSGGCDHIFCTCPGTYASIRHTKETLYFATNWGKKNKLHFNFNQLYLPYFNIEKQFKFDFQTEAITFQKNRGTPWTLSVKQGEFFFINTLYRKCSFSFELFFPAEYIESKRKELNDIISSFYQDNQAKFAAEHLKHMAKLKNKENKK
jgi:hypothetical protein